MFGEQNSLGPNPSKFGVGKRGPVRQEAQYRSHRSSEMHQEKLRQQRPQNPFEGAQPKMHCSCVFVFAVWVCCLGFCSFAAKNH